MDRVARSSATSSRAARVGTATSHATGLFDIWLVPDVGSVLTSARELIGARRDEVSVTVTSHRKVSTSRVSEAAAVRAGFDRLLTGLDAEPGSPQRQIRGMAARLLAALVPVAVTDAAKYQPPLIADATLPRQHLADSGFPLLDFEVDETGPLVVVYPTPHQSELSGVLNASPRDLLANLAYAAGRMAPNDPMASGLIVAEQSPGRKE